MNEWVNVLLNEITVGRKYCIVLTIINVHERMSRFSLYRYYITYLNKIVILAAVEVFGKALDKLIYFPLQHQMKPTKSIF